MTIVFGETSFSGTAKDLLNKLWNKKLTLPEFLRECAYWALRDGFDELKPMPYPPKPYSQAFGEYEALSAERKLKVKSEFFREHEDILKYYQDCFYVKWKNIHTKQWLEEIKDYLPEDDIPSRMRIEERIREFA